MDFEFYSLVKECKRLSEEITDIVMDLDGTEKMADFGMEKVSSQISRQRVYNIVEKLFDDKAEEFLTEMPEKIMFAEFAKDEVIKDTISRLFDKNIRIDLQAKVNELKKKS